jgi:heptosyltransferase-2
MAATECRHFNGYKPCALAETCSKACAQYSEIQESILLVHLGALGAVVRSTSLLLALRRKHPKAMLTWVTQAPAHKILEKHPLIDRVMPLTPETQMQLQAFHFDSAYVVDKNLQATSFVTSLNVTAVFGFKAHPKTGAILPATMAAMELWNLGLDNTKKFFENTKPETQLMIEALELGPFLRDEYFLPLTQSEAKLKYQRRKQWLKDPQQILLGFNTGCAATLPAKKWSKEFQLEVIQSCLRLGFQNVVLLGGPEDQERNQWLQSHLPTVIYSPTDKGLRDGLVSVAACDVVVSGDSLGMHMAISQKVYTIAWFGPSVAAEIDLYDRGEKLITSMPCSPCWKSSCDKTKMCYDSFAATEVVEAIIRGANFCQLQSAESLSSSQPFLETPSLV